MEALKTVKSHYCPYAARVLCQRKRKKSQSLSGENPGKQGKRPTRLSSCLSLRHQLLSRKPRRATNTSKESLQVCFSLV